MSELCKLWVKIFRFLSITRIEDKESGGLERYKEDIKQFEVNLKESYKVGRFTFLSSEHDEVDGDEEMFYLHALRFYMVPIAYTTLEWHQLGLGIFTIQGMERRNKESKSVFKRFTNN